MLKRFKEHFIIYRSFICEFNALAIIYRIFKKISCLVCFSPCTESCRSRRDVFNFPMTKTTQLFVYDKSDTHIRRALGHFDDLVREKFVHERIVHTVIQNMTEDEVMR